MKLFNTKTLEMISVDEFKSRHPNVSFPISIPTEFYQQYDFQPVFDTPRPDFDEYSQSCLETTPIKTSKGIYEQTWIVEGLTGESLTLSQERKTKDLEQKDSNRIQSLWQSAHDYEQRFISGSAIGLITMGCIQSLPKSIVVQNWIKSIWSEYYTRKDSGSIDTDFSMIGSCPHSVPELMLELGF
jgi:hypothetical protein